MGRGGGRSKASSTGATHEVEAVFVPVDLNTTLFEFILSGHFEKDYLSYCSNRLSAYTCRYWFNPNQSYNARSSYASTLLTHVDSDSQALNEESPSKEILGPIETHTEMLLRFTDPANIPVSLTGGLSRDGWNSSESTLLLSDLVPLTNGPGQKVCSIFLCISLLINIFLSLLSCHCLRRLASSGNLFIAKILLYLTILECIDLFLQLSDNLLDSTRGISLFTVMDLLGRWSCQTLAMGYTCLVHTEGLLISTLAANSIVFLKRLRYHLARFRAEWAFNMFILIVASTATASSQFFWTFDLFRVDNRMPPTESNLGGRIFVEPSLFTCGFSASWGLNHAFISYIWPIFDHLLGDAIPCIMSLVAGSTILINRHSALRKEQQELNTVAPEDLNALMWILPLLFLLYGFSILPRTLFYMGKYFIFSEKHLNRVGLIFHREDTQPIGNGPIIIAVAKVIPHRQIAPNVLPFLQNVEKALRFFPPLFLVAKACLIIFGFPRSRRILRMGLNHFLVMCNASTYSNGKPEIKPKTVEYSQNPERTNRFENIPFAMFNNSTISRVESVKVPMKANFEDIQELSV
ncbi:hypothetical protein Aperf_G00000026163 [Anoplocephala perfoliata]